MKSEEENDSFNTFIRQAIVKEPLLPFTRTGDNPVQWIQLLHALDQPDPLGWPLVTPIKVQMQRCEKCSLEFCSPINYRRHIRVHRRSLNVNKESHKNRDILAAFWDKLSLDETKEIVSFNGVMLKEIPGSSVIRALASSLCKPAVWTLPQVYVRAGSSLLDIIQAKPSRLPLSSRELFGILDDASERTFLCAGTPESVQKYLFGGEAAKSSLELKNLVACTSFLLEQQLMKAWLTDKNAEALRRQKLLVEEEEAAKKRLAELLERKKRKKLRQKEHKLKEQSHRCKGDFNFAADAADRPVLAGESGPSSPSDSSSNSIDGPLNLGYCLESLPFRSKYPEKDIEALIDFSSESISQGDAQTIEPQMVDEHIDQNLATNSWQEWNSQKVCQHAVNINPKIRTLKPDSIQKIGPSKDQAILNGSKACTRNDEIESHVESLKPLLQGRPSHQMEENNCEVIIGSISIPVNGCAAQQQHSYLNYAQDSCSQQPVMIRKNSEKLIESDTVQSGTKRTGSKLQRPVSRHENKGITAVERGNEDVVGVVVLKKIGDRIISGKTRMASKSTYDDFDYHDHVPSDGKALQGIVPFSVAAAREFLARRWKEAILADHVQLVLSSGSEVSI